MDSFQKCVYHINTMKFLGFTNHKITLKVESPVILLRNIEKSLRLCNDIRLIVL